jgi:hypothetical protein
MRRSILASCLTKSKNTEQALGKSLEKRLDTATLLYEVEPPKSMLTESQELPRVQKRKH